MIPRILLYARCLLDRPDHWTSFARARTKDGAPVKPLHWNAAAWNLEGALERESGGVIPFQLLVLVDQAARELYPASMSLTHANFDTGEQEVAMSDYFSWTTADAVADQLGREAAVAILERALELYDAEALRTNQSEESDDH